MKHQQGVALVIVMALLSGALMLGMSGMQSALIDEQLAGNYRASVQAQMNSDSMMSEFRNIVSQSLLDDISNGDYTQGEFLDHLEGVEGFKSLDTWVEFDNSVEGEVTIITRDKGTNNNAVRETVATYKKGSEDAGSGGGENGSGGNGGDSGGVSSRPFGSPVVGCEGVQSSGGSTFCTYSSDKQYKLGEECEQSDSSAEQDIPLVRTTAENANVVLGGNEKIHGGLEALGTVTLNGSSQVFGNILANQTIYLNGGGAYVERNTESLADVIFGSSARVNGVVRAQGDVRFNNYSASVGEGVYAGGDITSDRNPVSDHIDPNKRPNFFPNSNVSLNRVEEQLCDIVDFAGNSLSEEIARYQNVLVSIGDVVVNNGVVDITMTPSIISVSGSDTHGHVNGAVPSVDTLFGEAASIYYVDDLNMASTSKLQIKGGNVVLVVGGNFTMGGGGEGLVIDKGSSLTVFVAGKVDFGSVINMVEINSINSNGEASFSLFSGYRGPDTGVSFNSSSRVVANVYAPYTNVSVNSGAHFFGSIRGRNVSMSGYGSIVYDEVLGGAFGDPEEVWELIGWQ